MFQQFVSNQKRFIIFLIAVLIITVSGLSIWFYQDFEGTINYTTAKGEIKQYKLPFDIAVSLDENATLNFEATPENIILINLSGQVYLELPLLKNKVYQIKHEELGVNTNGGSFMIRNTHNGKEVFVLSESIELVRFNQRGEEMKLGLSKGETGIIIDQQKSLLKMNTRDKNFLAWVNKKITFDGASLQEVTDLLTKVYKVEVIPSNTSVSRCKYTGKFDNQPLDIVVSDIAKRLQLTVIRSTVGITLEGTGC